MRELEKKPFDLCFVLRTTAFQRELYETCRMVVEDPDKQARLDAQECVGCFYAHKRVGGSSCTDSLCRKCGERMSFCNTCTDELCQGCAREHRLCRRCGADMYLKHRRKL